MEINNIKFLLLRPHLLAKNILTGMLSFYYTKRFVDEGKGKIIIHNPFLRIKFAKGIGSNLILDGNLHITPHLLGRDRVVIQMAKNSRLHVGGDLILGNGVKIMLNNDAQLFFGGRHLESGSGITANSMVLVNKNIKIGKDLLCAWGVLITDSDWHHIDGHHHQKDVVIHDHVWIANNSSVLKGSVISEGCIIASNSKVSNKNIPARSLVVGNKGDIIKSNVNWCRDID